MSDDVEGGGLADIPRRQGIVTKLLSSIGINPKVTGIARIKLVAPAAIVAATIAMSVLRGSLLDWGILFENIVFNGSFVLFYVPYLFLGNRERSHGVLHLIVILIALMVFPAMHLIEAVSNQEDGQLLAMLFLITVWLALVLVALISSVVAVSRSILPSLRRSMGRLATGDEPVVETFNIQSRVDTIRRVVRDLHRLVSEERSGLESVFSRIEQEIEAQEEARIKAARQLKIAQEEARHYEALASVSREAQDAFLKELQRQWRGNHVFVFVLGVASSALVAAAARMLTFVLEHGVGLESVVGTR